MIEINESKCVRCGACADICEFHDIEMTKDGPLAGIYNDCCDCGHCLAVCPAGAVTMPGYGADQVVEYRKDTFSVNPDDFLNFIKFRRSTRRFKPEPVPEEEIKKLLEAGRYCPTSCNCQDVEYVVVHRSREKIVKMLWDGLYDYAGQTGDENLKARYKAWQETKGREDTLTYGCSHIIFILSGRQLNGGIAACAIEFMANAMGFGALYCGYAERAAAVSGQLKKWLGITPDRQLTAVLCIGYPDIRWRRTVPRKEVNVRWD